MDNEIEDSIIERETRLECVKALWPQLTVRQRECWLLQCLGLTQEEIGAVLSLDQSNVSRCLSDIWDKLGSWG
jgi:DNA-directed RNA polymerase specialized sigma24 family protein